ncbi:MAG: hypothetical protein Q8O34_16450 [Rhodocyclaceae bacterium]|nr:hypothetical protein [Rhodocyclaceae bacterium]
MGLVIFGAMALYLLIAIFVVTWAISHAKEQGKSAKRWGWGAALVMYLIPFWDWLPTVAMHRYYCATEAGFWVYKTSEQWKKENLGVMEGLIYNKTMPHIQSPYGAATVLNERFIHLYKYEGSFPLNRWRTTTEIRDSKNGDVIAREIGFSTSQERPQAGWSGWKFWLSSERCNTESHRDQGSFDKVTAQLEGTKI